MSMNDSMGSAQAAERLKKRVKAARENVKSSREINEKLDAIAERLDDMLAVAYDAEDGEESTEEDEFLNRLDFIKDEISSLKDKIDALDEKVSSGEVSESAAAEAGDESRGDSDEKIEELSESFHSESVTLYRNIKADLDAVFQDISEIMQEAAKPPKKSAALGWVLTFSILDFILLGGYILYDTGVFNMIMKMMGM